MNDEKAIYHIPFAPGKIPVWPDFQPTAMKIVNERLGNKGDAGLFFAKWLFLTIPNPTAILLEQRARGGRGGNISRFPSRMYSTRKYAYSCRVVERAFMVDCAIPKCSVGWGTPRGNMLKGLVSYVWQRDSIDDGEGIAIWKRQRACLLGVEKGGFCHFPSVH